MMLNQLLLKSLAIEYENRIIIFDYDNFSEYYKELLIENHFTLWFYEDIEAFRKYYEESIKGKPEHKVAVIIHKELYVPFDVQQSFYKVILKYETLFTNLNREVLIKYKRDLDIIAFACEHLYEKKTDQEESEEFIKSVVFSTKNVKDYCKKIISQIIEKSTQVLKYEDWMQVAKDKARILYYASKTGCEELYDPFPEIDELFEVFINDNYKYLSGENKKDYPVMLPKVMQHFVKEKTALIVMDGMSLFDFEVLFRKFPDIEIEEKESFALVPTVTSISRQSLMSGKYPVELVNPFNLRDEKKGFCEAGAELGYRNNQIQYERGYSFSISPTTKLLGVIINDVDDIMHGQRQGRTGMYNDLMQMAKENQLRAGYDWFAGRKNAQSTSLLESFGLVTGEKLTVSNSKYAKYFIQLLEQKGNGAVINFSDIYEESIDGYGWIDRHFKISNYLLPVVFLALVSSGNIVLTLSDNTTINASNLDTVPKVTQDKFHEFKYISKPKDIQLSELVKLYEILELPVGLINNPSQREAGLDQLLKKTGELAGEAVRAKSKLNDEFSLWGEPLLADHIADGYRKAASNVIDMFSNFTSKYNTVAKLNNFTYSMQEVEQIGNDIQTVKTIKEYEKFKASCSANAIYMMNLESLELGATLKGELENAKDDFRKMRDSLPVEMDGDAIGNDANSILAKVKDRYIDFYYEEHKRRRLNITETKKKGEIQSSNKLMNLKKLKGLSIFSASKLEIIETELAGLKTCFDLTSDMLKTTHICPKCNYVIGNNEAIVKGKLEEVEDKIENLYSEWTTSLWNTLSDPYLLEQMKYLNKEQQKIIDTFVEKKELPEKVDQFFVSAVETLLEGFDPVEIKADTLINELESMGSVDVANFRKKIDMLLNEYTKGKDVRKFHIKQ